MGSNKTRLPNLSCLPCHTRPTDVVFDTFDRASVEQLRSDLRNKIKPDNLQDGPSHDRPEACPYCLRPLSEASHAAPNTRAVVAAVQGPDAFGHVLHKDCAVEIYRVMGRVDCPVAACGKPISPRNWQTPLSHVPRERDVVLTYDELARMLQEGKRKAENMSDEVERERAGGAMRFAERLAKRLR